MARKRKTDKKGAGEADDSSRLSSQASSTGGTTKGQGSTKNRTDPLRKGSSLQMSTANTTTVSTASAGPPKNSIGSIVPILTYQQDHETPNPFDLLGDSNLGDAYGVDDDAEESEKPEPKKGSRRKERMRDGKRKTRPNKQPNPKTLDSSSRSTSGHIQSTTTGFDPPPQPGTDEWLNRLSYKSGSEKVKEHILAFDHLVSECQSAYGDIKKSKDADLTAARDRAERLLGRLSNVEDSGRGLMSTPFVSSQELGGCPLKVSDVMNSIMQKATAHNHRRAQHGQCFDVALGRASAAGIRLNSALIGEDLCRRYATHEASSVKPLTTFIYQWDHFVRSGDETRKFQGEDGSWEEMNLDEFVQRCLPPEAEKYNAGRIKLAEELGNSDLATKGIRTVCQLAHGKPCSSFVRQTGTRPCQDNSCNVLSVDTFAELQGIADRHGLSRLQLFPGSRHDAK